MKLYSVSYRVHKYKNKYKCKKNNRPTYSTIYKLLIQITATAYLRNRVTRIRVNRRVAGAPKHFRRQEGGRRRTDGHLLGKSTPLLLLLILLLFALIINN
jgi:hypothetical protein